MIHSHSLVLFSILTIALFMVGPLGGPSQAAEWDPCELAKLLPGSGSTGDRFGQSVDIRGNRVIAGARAHDLAAENGGAAFIFRRDGSGWIEEAVLTAGDAELYDFFGDTVAISDRWAVVGASGANDPAGGIGVVYVFEREGNVWTESSMLTSSDPEGGRRFGSALDVGEDLVVVGDPYDDAWDTNSGSVFVFRYDGGGWYEEDKLVPADGMGGDYFGSAVSLSDERVLIGTPGDLYSGSAWFYRYNGAGWIAEARITGNNPEGANSFGNAVALDGDLALVADEEDSSAGYATGAAYIFRKNGTVWSQEALVTADDGAHLDWFGSAADLSAGTAIIGAHRDDDLGESSGSAYIFEEDDSQWRQTHKLTAGDGSSLDWFGVSVAMDGPLAIAGACRDDDFGESSGSDYVFGLRPAVCGTLLFVAPGPGPENQTLCRGFLLAEEETVLYLETDTYPSLEGYGIRLATGDLDGDGVREFLTGPGPGPDHPPLIRAFSDVGFPFAGVDFAAYGVNRFGVNLACGDLDGDGFDEIVTGPGPGAVFGPHVRGWDVDGDSARAMHDVNFLSYGTHRWGVNVCCGDVDGDGYDEIITGAGPGAVFGPHVRGWDMDNAPVVSIPAINYFAYRTHRWGVNVACADIDGDGFDEIVTGAGPGAVFGPHVRGWNFDGTSLSAIPSVSFLAYGTHHWGVRVTGGDLDGDGFDELVTTPGPGGSFTSHLRGWNVDGGTAEPLPWLDFIAYDGSVRFGADAAVVQPLP